VSCKVKVHCLEQLKAVIDLCGFQEACRKRCPEGC